MPRNWNLNWKEITPLIITSVLTLCIIGVLIYAMESYNECGKNDAETVLNHTSKACFHSVHIGNGVYTHICSLNGRNILDIRLFINQTATIKGIQLNKKQFNNLFKEISNIHSVF